MKIITLPMIGVYSFDINGPFIQVFYFSFLIAEATSLLFFLWWVDRRIVMASVIRSLGITGISGYPLAVEMAIIAGLQTTTIVGLGDSAIKVAKDRLLSEKH